MKDYKIYKNVISHDKIDKFLNSHNQFKRSRFSIFRAQGTTDFEKPILNKYNNQKNSIHNPHLLGFKFKFRKQLSDIIFSNELHECLCDFFDKDNFIHYQSMFFDVSTATKLHQDNWYLDTTPPKNLVGVWIALEDIKEGSGPFCVYTNSDKNKLSIDSYNFDNLDKDESFKEKNSKSKRYDFYANKGDILIWNSYVIHGAVDPTSESLTRKSLTSHYYPRGFNVQAQPIKRFFSIYNHKNPRTTKHPNLFQAATINPILYNSMCFSLWMLGGLKNLFSGDNKANSRLSKIRKIN